MLNNCKLIHGYSCRVARPFRSVMIGFVVATMVSCSGKSSLKSKISKLFGSNPTKNTSGAASGDGANASYSYCSVVNGVISDAVTFDGKLEAAEKIEIRTDKRLRVGPAKFKESDPVKRGDILFVVDAKELEQKRIETRERLEQLKVDIKASRAQFTFAGKQLDRKKGLVSKGIAAQKELEEAEKLFVAAESDLKTKELETRKAERELATANDSVTAANIVSPIDGIVASIVPGGDEINQGQSLATVANPTELAVTGQVDELSVTKVKVGQAVEIQLDALKGESVKGIIKSIDSNKQKNGAMNLYSVKVAIPQDVVKKNSLRVGYAAKVNSVMGSKENALLVPRAAIKQEGDKFYVLVGDAIGGSTTARAVTLGIQTTLEVEVTNGLNPGDKVAAVLKTEGAQQ